LTLGSGGGVVNNGIITFTANTDNLAITLSGTGTYTGTGVLNSTCTAAAAVDWSAATAWGASDKARCGVTVGSGTAPLPSAGSIVAIGAFAIGAAPAVTVKSLTLSNAASRLTLSGPLKVTTDLIFGDAGAILTATGQTITLGGGLTTAASANIAGSPNLVLTDANHTSSQSAAITLGTLTLTPPTSTTAERTIIAGTGGINVTSYSLGACATAASGTTASTFSATAPQIPAAAYYCKLAPVVPGVAAPLFSTKEKAAVFSQEVK